MQGKAKKSGNRTRRDQARQGRKKLWTSSDTFNKSGTGWITLSQETRGAIVDIADWEGAWSA